MKKASLILLLLLITACQPPASEEVNLYSARKETLMQPLLEAFTEETGIAVNIISSKADALLTRIQNEGINSPADVLLTTDAGRLHRAKTADIFAPIESALLSEAIPDQYRDQTKHWFGLSVRARPIMITDAAAELKLTSYEDLARPELAGKICIRSSGNIYNQSLTASFLEHLGESETENWAKGLVSNFARKPQGGDRDQIRAAAAGQCSVVVANTYYLANMLADQSNSQDFNAASKMRVIWPNQNNRGTHVNISGAGMLKTAPNKGNAIKLIEFLASNTAQKIYADVNFEYPVKPGIELNSILKGWGEFKADQLPLDKLGEKNVSAVQVMDRAGWK